MKTENFTKLIQAITDRPFTIRTDDEFIQLNSEYYIFYKTQIINITCGFKFKTPKNIENLIKCFVNTYINKYKQPNPQHYTSKRTESLNWDTMSDEDKECACFHHASNMYSKNDLLEQIKTNLDKPGIDKTLCQYGFYNTLYGIGIFVLFAGKYEMIAINKLREFLINKNIPYKNEYSDAMWVYRFIININKDIHMGLIKEFSQSF